MLPRLEKKKRAGQVTHDNASKTRLGVAVALQLLGHGDEDTGGKRHVEDTILLLGLAALFHLLKVLVEVDERVILVVLAGNVRTQLAELI